MTDPCPRMWWLVVKGDRRRILAVEWCAGLGKLSRSSLQMRNLYRCSTVHPWPTHIRAMARGLRMRDASLHLVAWCEDQDIVALGLANKRKMKMQAMCLAYDLCRAWPNAGNPANDAPKIHIDPAEYYSDDYVPKHSLPTHSRFAVALFKVDGVSGFFFDQREEAQSFFSSVRFGEWPAALLGPDGKEIDHWHQRYSKNIARSVWKWWSQSRAKGLLSLASTALQPELQDRDDKDGIKFDEDPGVIDAVKACNVSHQGHKHDVPPAVKHEETLMTVPGSELTQPRMWWLVVKGDRRRILAVEWCAGLGKLSRSSLQMRNLYRCSTVHPWPTHIRAMARGLRMRDASLHLFAWCEDQDIVALGLANKRKMKMQAMCLAYDLCRAWPNAGNPANDAPKIHIDPAEYYSDDYVPKHSLPTHSRFAVALIKVDGVSGFFFDQREEAQSFFSSVRFGEWPAALLGPDGKEIDHWHQRYSKNIARSVWKWWSQSRAKGLLSLASTALQPELQDRDDKDCIKLEADVQGIDMVEFIKASFLGKEDTVESVFEKMRANIHATVKEEEVTMTVPVSELLYTQRKCSRFFRCMHRLLSNMCSRCCTRSVEDTAEEVVKGMDPSKEDWARLDVVRYRGRLRSIENRRLYAFRHAQEILREQGSERVVQARIRVFVWKEQFDRFLQHMHYMDDPDGGGSIYVSRKRHLDEPDGGFFYARGRQYGHKRHRFA